MLESKDAEPVHTDSLQNPAMHQVWLETKNGEDRVLPSETRILVVIYLRKRKKNKTISASVKCYEWTETGPYDRETGGRGGGGGEKDLSGDAVCAKP